MSRRESFTPSFPPGSGGISILVFLIAALILPGLASAQDAGGDTADPGVAEAVADRPPAMEAPAEAEGSEPYESVPETPEVEASDDLEWAISGFARASSRYRQTGSEQDLDLRAHVVADVRHRGDVPFRLRFNGRGFADVLEDQDPGDWFRDYWDGRDGDVHGRLYEAFGEIEGLMEKTLDIRAGRQFIEEGSWFHFDGLRIDLDLDRLFPSLEVTGLVGIPVTFDEEDRSDRWLAGFVVRAKVADRTRLRFEYYHLSEDFDGINDPIVDPLQQQVALADDGLDDDVFALSAWHRIGETIRLFGRFSLLNGDANELHARGRWNSEDGRFTVVVEHYRMFERLANVTNDLTPYAPMMGSYQPFWRLGARVDFRLDDGWILQAGYTRRSLEDSGDEGTFNHDYDNYFGGVTALGLLDPRFDLSVVVNGYAADDNDVVAVGGHADFRLSPEVSVSGGVDYALFEYDWFLDDEREDVWTYSLGGRWRITDTVDIRGRLSYDEDRFRSYTTLDLSVTVRF